MQEPPAALLPKAAGTALRADLQTATIARNTGFSSRFIQRNSKGKGKTMISDKMQRALNDQLNLELYSSYVYAAMAAHFEFKNLHGFANWFEVQVKEELGHAGKFYKYINDQGAQVTLGAIAQPPAEFKTPSAAFEESLAHERKVTQSINQLMGLAVSESDYATVAFLQWFVTEQVEEESNVDDVLQKLKMAGEDPRGLFMIDRQLAFRGK
jgi:ferritin